MATQNIAIVNADHTSQSIKPQTFGHTKGERSFIAHSMASDVFNQNQEKKQKVACLYLAETITRSGSRGG